MPIAVRLQFTKEERAAAADIALAKLHHEVCEADEDNSGVDAANTATQAAEGGARTVQQHRARQCRAARQDFSLQYGGFSSNPYSRFQQKRAIKTEYARAKKRNGSIASAAQTSAKAAARATRETKRTGKLVARHRKGLMVIGAAALVLVMLLSLLFSCSVMLQGGISSIAASTYPSEDSDMLAAEAQYCAMEAELQSYLDNYENTHSYDEYHYNLESIGHDPYVLISIITAYMGGEWTVDEVQDVLAMLFSRQYTLTETVTTEASTGTEAEGDSAYYNCTVMLDNFDLSHLPIYIMGETKLSAYAVYMRALGNRPDLFPSSSYVYRYYTKVYEPYEIPPEALADERFAAMIEEAEKYLGYPYVWGGYNPNTSFDCSGFVSWVINHSGWDVGRLTAQGLRSICTIVPESEARPGDLVFLTGTYDTPGASHVGLYVGGGMTIHAGDPICYASIENAYWQSHFYGFGRLPEPE